MPAIGPAISGETLVTTAWNVSSVLSPRSAKVAVLSVSIIG